MANTETRTRSGLPINLTPEARHIVEGIKDETGISKQVAVAKVLEWFAQQHVDVRKAILYGHDAAAELVKLRDAADGEPDSLEAVIAEADRANERLKRVAKEAHNALKATSRKK